MTEPTGICPNCKSEIKLTESLAAPLIESTRRQFEQQLVQKDNYTPSASRSCAKRRGSLPMPMDELRLATWYRALNVRRTDRQRDPSRLREQRLLKLDKQGRLWPEFVAIAEQG